MAAGSLGGDNKTGYDKTKNLGEGSFGNRSRQLEAQRREEALQAFSWKLKKKYADEEDAYKDKLDKKRQAYDSAQKKKAERDQQAFYKKLSKEVWAENHKQAAALGSSLKNSLNNAVKNTWSGLNRGIDTYLGAYSKYMSGIEARLQGSTKSFSSVTGLLTRNIGSSQYVSQAKVLENLSKLVEQGISYNVEQRAFLSTVSEKIATTFDAFNSNLSQIIRIQQADSTAARLGLEAHLTKFFNSNFGDTSYLNSMFDSVSSNLFGIESQLGRDRAIELEYIVQKWLGSLSSVGLSDNTIQQLAQGINYLGTGDITSLNGQTALQNLLVMAANRSGMDYATMLTSGIDATSANKLLRGVVKFGQEIANNSNQVVRSQYANLFGLTISDMTALLNLSSEDLISISNNMLKYSSAIGETEQQLKAISGRTSMQERIETMFDNIMSTVGEGIANSAGNYTTWLVNDLIEKATGGINIPFVNVLGSGVDINANVNQLLKLGIVGASTLSNIGAIMSGLSGANKLSLNNWNSSDTVRTSAGWGFNGIATIGVSSTSSQTAYIGNSSSSDIYEGSIAGARESAKESVQGQEEPNEMCEVLKNRIAVDVADILAILRVWSSDGILIQNNISGLPY